MAQNAKNKVRESEVLNDIGYTLVILGYHEEALTYLLEGLEIIQAGNDLDMIQNMEDSLCNAYLGLGDYDKALKHGLRAIQLGESLNDPNSEVKIRVSIVKVYLAMGEEEKAFKTLQKGYELADKYNFPREKSMASKLLGEIHLNQGNLDQAKEYLDISLDLANQLDLPRNIYEIHKTLTEYHKKRGDFEQALNHFETYNELKETSQHDQAINLFRSQFLEMQIQEAKRDAEIYQQNIELLTKEIEKGLQLTAKLHKMAITDPLTGLNNRGHFFNLAETWMGIAQKNNYPLSIIMMDIDHFKQVNDNNGHRVGDQVLEELARRIQAGLRSQDISGRYGGEEFIALLPETNVKDAKQIAKRLHNKITKMPYKTNKLDLEIKISLGIAALTDPKSMSLEELVDKADQALYEAKEKGRNQIKIFGE